MCVMIFVRSHNCVITITKQLSTTPLESHSNSTEQGFMMVHAMMMNSCNACTLYKLFVQVLLLDVHSKIVLELWWTPATCYYNNEISPT